MTRLLSTIAALVLVLTASAIAGPYGEAKRGIPYTYRLAATSAGTACYIRGPGMTVQTASSPAVTLLTDSTSAPGVQTQVTFTPNLCGLWTATTTTASSVLDEREVRVVDATDQEQMLGLQNSYHGLATIWPSLCTTGALDSTVNARGGTAAIWISTRKFVVPYDGLIYGIKIIPADGNGLAQPAVTSVRFFTGYVTSVDASTPPLVTGFKVRGVSEDIHTYGTSDGTSWTSSTYSEVRFKAPIPACAGDVFGFEILVSSGNYSVVCQTVTSTSLSAALQSLRSASTTLSLTAENAVSIVGAGVTTMMACKLEMAPPSIVLAGDSIMASHMAAAVGSTYQGATVYEDGGYVYTASNDLAQKVAQNLGVPVCNIAFGSTSLQNWIGDPAAAAGYAETDLAGLQPAMMVYGTFFNDRANTVANVIGWLDRLAAHCAHYNCQLAILESTPALTSVSESPSYAANLEAINAAAAAWCQQNGFLFIPTRFRLGRHTAAGTEDAAYRWSQFAGVGTTLASYFDAADNTHLSDAGYTALALQIAAAIRNRAVMPRIYMSRTPYAGVVPSDAATPGAAAVTAVSNQISNLPDNTAKALYPGLNR